jgi:hypothetical protein
MLDWVIDAFDPNKFPWFRDEFIHPKDLPKVVEGEAVVNMFAGFGGNRFAESDDPYLGMTA